MAFFPPSQKVEWGFRWRDKSQPVVEREIDHPETTMLDTISEHVKVLKSEKRVALKSPDGLTDWIIELRGSDIPRIQVYFRDERHPSWRPLNVGWAFSSDVKPLDGARIIIGQIMVGTRLSGYRLESLRCGLLVNDVKPVDPLSAQRVL